MKFRFVAKEKLEKIPKALGVYALNAGREILYIGKAVNLRERVKNHFQKSSYRDNLFVDKIDRVGWIETQSDIDALLLESQLIKQKKPRYNVMWRDDKQYFYVGITREQLPRVFLTHQPQNRRTTQNHTQNNAESFSVVQRSNQRGSAVIIGPFVDGKAIKQVLRLLRRVFPYYTQKKHPALPCPWCHLNLCPGPTPNAKEYQKSIKNLTAVLQGKRTSVRTQLKKEMEDAAKQQDFERAALLRDQYSALERIMAHRLSIAESLGISMLSQEYSELEKKLQKLFWTKKRIMRVEAYDISNIQGKFSTGSMVTFLQGKPAKEWYRKFKIHITGKPNDFAMMEELVSRRLKHQEWPYPNLMVIDGGKPQLSATLQAIKRASSILHGRRLVMTQIKNIQLAALAKRHNELFLAGRKTSILLKNLPQEVSHLLLHIRDEAHRFAVTYHRYLRKKGLLQEKS